MNDRFAKLSRYAEDLKNKLEEKQVPEKHVSNPTTYRQFLTRELAMVNKKLEAMRLDGTAQKAK